jgi:colanic acid biosynthesis protein WcaH
MQFIPVEEFKAVVKNSNLFALDLIIKTQEDKILLGMRNNPPARGSWFVPGGRVCKNETLQDAFRRILIGETGIQYDRITSLGLHGLYEHIYEDNCFQDPTFNTHYIIAAIEVVIKEECEIKLDRQHANFRLASVPEILIDPLIHQYVKNYFITSPSNRFPDFSFHY